MDLQDIQRHASHVGHILIRLSNNLESKVIFFFLKLPNSNVSST